MTYKILLLMFISQWVIALSGHAQKAPLKWGKITSEEAAWKPPGDAGHHASILFDYGVLRFADRNDISLTRHVRILFYKAPEQGKYMLDIPLNELAGDQLSRIKAQVLSPAASGKYTEEEIRKEDLLYQDGKDKSGGTSLVFTGLTGGEIVEVQYVVSSANPRIPKKWNFQSNLPVMHSEVRLSPGELVKVDVFYHGILLTNKYRRQATDQWILNDVMPIPEEPFSPHPSEYLEQAIFQVAGFYTKSASYGLDRQMDFISNEMPWNILAIDLLKSDAFRSYLSKKSTMDNDSLLSRIADLSVREKVKAIFDFILQNYQWNDTYALYPDVDADVLHESKSGNGTALNLLFVKILSASGFEAHPVAVSTTAHGSVQKNYPDLSQFNHVITSVQLHGKDQLIDVSDAFTPYTLLPLHDINGEGYLLDLEDSRWLELSTNMKKKRFNNLEMTFEDGLKQRIKLRSQYNDYAASMMRKEIAESEGGDMLASTCLPYISDNLALDSIRFSDRDLTDKPLKINAVYVGEEIFEDTIAFAPVMMPIFSSNPFQAESRVLPVDFIVPLEDSYTIVINVPEGFEIGYIPAPYELNLPGKKGGFSYQVTVDGNRIKIRSVVKLEEVFYSTSEYEELRVFFGKYCDKIQERVVLLRM